MERRWKLIERRELMGFSQETFAHAVGVDFSTAGRWERGEQTPQAWRRARIATALDISLDELQALLAKPTPEPELLAARTPGETVASPFREVGAPLNASLAVHDELLRITGQAARDSLAFVERAAVFDDSSRDVVEHLRWEISRISLAYVSTPPRALLTDLIAVRDTTATLLQRRQRPKQARDLYFLASAAGLLLAHAAQNVGDHQSALAQLRVAWTCANAAGHDALRAWARGSAALINEWSPHRAHAALELVEQGNRYRAGTQNRIRLTAIEARSAARAGNRTRALDALARLHAMNEIPVDDDDVTDLGGLFAFPLAKVCYYMGGTHGLLGQHEQAEHHALTALTAYETGPAASYSYGDAGLARLDVVNARIAHADLDGAAHALAPLLVLPADQRIRQFDTAIVTTRATLTGSPLATSIAARQLGEQIHAFGPTGKVALPSGR
ncbi:MULTISPECIES: helix-turn-helix transcriptional regulator [Actinosynnema]|uniref:helix-turn-helix domain-containing protein n=1 Tax=Actinosynnema TaxID=40566 RepID=UPI0020A5EB08|nr:helix-turn-helix transcriptional regulator [Actinosynnema pretiosum]MCP2094714.1 DNA-binding transcriptional regulator, XRE-family HTH domain [Actinosynnema pretiosum]